ncbi:hypothetical protein A8B73_13110 [Methylosinus sp. 3S-1]|nr:hypothetical protein A8B73_13110 [Methylosinus sp. 3S-1]
MELAKGFEPSTTSLARLILGYQFARQNRHYDVENTGILEVGGLRLDSRLHHKNKTLKSLTVGVICATDGSDLMFLIFISNLEGRPCILASSGAELRLSNALNGEHIGTSMRHDGVVRGALFVADLAGIPRILAWSEDGVLCWWNARTTEPIGAAMRHDDGVNGAQFLPDVEGRPRLLSWSDDGILRWWDALTGEPVGAAMRHDSAVLGALYAPDFPGGARLLSWADDGVTRWWDALTGEPIGMPIRH